MGCSLRPLSNYSRKGNRNSPVGRQTGLRQEIFFPEEEFLQMFFRRSFHLVVMWVLFENAMSLHRFKAVLIGLIEAKRANEWVVTQKQGDAPRMNAPRCANPDLESPLLLDDASTRNTRKNIAKRYYLSLSARTYVSTNLSLSLSLPLRTLYAHADHRVDFWR